MSVEADLTVIGGGPAGASLGLAAAAAGLSVVIIEGNAAPSIKVGESLAPESRPALQTLGVWKSFAGGENHLMSHGNVIAWGQGPAEQDFICNPFGNGWQLDRIGFERTLLRAAAEAGAIVHCSQSVKKIGRVGALWKTATDAVTVQSRWLANATGRRSRVLQSQGVRRLVLDRLVAVHAGAYSKTGTDHDGRTFVESAREGWWYTALTPGGRRTVSFQTDADLLPARESRSGAWFSAKLANTSLIGPLLREHGYTFPSSPQITSAHSGRLERFAGDDWLAAGDAAMSFDPLSGRGILKALQNGIEAARVFGAGNAPALTAYEAEREREWTDFLNQRRHFYQLERRWVDQPFWKRRMTF